MAPTKGLNAHHIADEVLATQHQNSNSPARPMYEARFQIWTIPPVKPRSSHFKIQERPCLTGVHMCLWHSPYPWPTREKRLGLSMSILTPSIAGTSQHITTNSPQPVQTARPPAEKKNLSPARPAIFGATRIAWEVDNAECNFMQPSATGWPRFNS